MRTSTVRLLGFCFASSTALGCSAGDLTLPGDGQSARTGDRLPLPLVVLALDAIGRPVMGAAVAFEFLDGADGAVQALAPTTDDSGHAAAQVQLGMAPGQQRVLARIGDGPAAQVTFLATALAPPPPPPPRQDDDDDHNDGGVGGGGGGGGDPTDGGGGGGGDDDKGGKGKGKGGGKGKD